MIFSKHILGQILKLEASDWAKVYSTLNSVGLEVESYKKLQAPKRVVVGYILEAQKHPDADKLQVCKVAVGGSLSFNKDGAVSDFSNAEIKQIVCGAKNARAGLFVAVALEGAELPNGLKIKKAKLRGVESCGMLCSASELGFAAVNSGILELDASIGELANRDDIFNLFENKKLNIDILQIGRELCEYGAFNDEIYEISPTPNRGDCLCLLGVARELGAAFGASVIGFNSPSETNLGIGRILQISNYSSLKNSGALASFRLLSADLVSSFEDCAFSVNLPLAYLLFLAYNESLQISTNTANNDISSINISFANAANLASLYSGVLLNIYAFSTEQIKLEMAQDSGFVKILKDGAALQNFGVSEIGADFSGFKIEKNATKETLIESSEQNSQNTLFLAVCASYIEPENIAKACAKSKDKSLQKPATDAFYRAFRGSNPNLKVGLDFICSLLKSPRRLLFADSLDFGDIKERKKISIELSEIAMQIGIEKLDESAAVRSLEALGFEIETSSQKGLLSLCVPFWRHDISSAQDICEEIVRFIGIDNIHSKPLQITQNRQENSSYALYKARRTIAQKAVGAGFYECVHFVFNDEAQLKSLGFAMPPKSLALTNPITAELSVLRPTLLLALAQAAARNHNAGFSSVRLFEIGSTFNENRIERTKFAALQSGLLREVRFPHSKGLTNLANNADSGLYDFAESMSRILGEFSLLPKEPKTSLLHPNKSAQIIQNGEVIGILAALHPSFCEQLDLNNAFVCEVDLDKIKAHSPQITSFSRFQKNIRDLSILISRDIPYFEISAVLKAAQITFVSAFYPLDVYSDERLKDKISLTIRFELQSAERTLEERDIAGAIELARELLEQKFDATQR